MFLVINVPGDNCPTSVLGPFKSKEEAESWLKRIGGTQERYCGKMCWVVGEGNFHVREISAPWEPEVKRPKVESRGYWYP